MVKPLNWKGRFINVMAKWKTWYDKGISILSVIRNMEITDLGILMGVAKYLFGDSLSTSTILILGLSYWVLNTLVNLSVGWFWERNDGWRIEAEVFGQRREAGRMILLNPDGIPYGSKEIAEEIAEEIVKCQAKSIL